MKEKFSEWDFFSPDGYVLGFLGIGMGCLLLALPYNIMGIPSYWWCYLYFVIASGSCGYLFLLGYVKYQHAWKKKRKENIPVSFVYQLSEASHSAQHLNELLAHIHQILAEFMSARNMYIALLDPATDELSFPYFIDEYDTPPRSRKQGKGLTEYVLRTGKPTVISPALFERLRQRGEVELIGTPAVYWLGVPLKIHQRTIGALVVQSYVETLRYGELEKEMLTSVAPCIAMAIEQVQAEEKLRSAQSDLEKLVEQRTAKLLKVYEQLAALYEVGHTITASLHLDQVLKTIVQSTTEVLETDTAVIFLRDEADNTLHVQAGYGVSQHLLHIIESQQEQHITLQVLHTGQSQINNNMSVPPWFLSDPGIPLACASVPLCCGDNILGTLDVYSQSGTKVFTNYHVQLLEMLASQAAIAIENARLYEGLQKGKEQLELQVQERTAELMLANSRLRHEIHERARAENALTEERNLLRALIDHLPDYIYVKNSQSQFLTANHALLRLMRVLTVEEVLGKTDFDFFPRNLAEQYYASDQEILTSGRPQINHIETIINQETGVTEWLRMTKVPFRGGQGEILGLIGISHDITELKRTQELLQQHNRELELLNRMSERFQSCEREDETYQILMDMCQQLFPDDSGYLALVDESRTRLTRVASWGKCSCDLPAHAEVEWGCQQRQLQVNTPDNADQEWAYHSFSLQAGHLVTPILNVGEQLGVLSLYSQNGHQKHQQIESFRKSKQMLLLRIVEHYALSLTNLRLREKLRLESIRDSLTGLYNRRYMEAALKQESARVKRHKSLFGIIMLDLDHFKAFNDRYGHNVGDAVLQELGKFLTSNIRGEDVACRYGGEEFLLILSGASLGNTRQRAEQLWLKLRDFKVIYRERQFSMTASIGVAALPYHGPEVMDVVKAADDALYLAKAHGRNQVVVAPYESIIDSTTSFPE